MSMKEGRERTAFHEKILPALYFLVRLILHGIRSRSRYEEQINSSLNCCDSSSDVGMVLFSAYVRYDFCFVPFNFFVDLQQNGC